MIIITNGSITLTVPTASYQPFYAPTGFRPLAHQKQREETGSVSADTFNGGDVPAEVAEDDPDLSEIPLGEMDFYQLSDYADQLGVDHKGVRSKRELRNLIKSSL